MRSRGSRFFATALSCAFAIVSLASCGDSVSNESPQKRLTGENLSPPPTQGGSQSIETAQAPLLSPDDERNLAELEASLAQSKPVDGAALAQMDARFTAILERVVESPRQNLVNRLALVKWNLDASRMLAVKPQTLADSEEAERQMRQLLADQPGKASITMQQALEARLKPLEASNEAWHKRQSIGEAKTALAGGKADWLRHWEELEHFESDDEVVTLRKQLLEKAAQQIAAARIGTLRDSMERARKLTDGLLKQAALARVSEGALSLLLDPDPVLAAAADSGARELLAASTTEQARLQDEAHRNYQIWALAQIERCNQWQYEGMVTWLEDSFKKFEKTTKDLDFDLFRVFPQSKEKFKLLANVDLSDLKDSKLTVADQQRIYKGIYRRVGWAGNIHKELAYLTCREAVVKYLLPIDEARLDRPVAQLYQRAFDRAWTALDGHKDNDVDDQLYIARKAAEIERRRP